MVVLQAAVWQLMVEALREKPNLHPSAAVMQAAVWQLLVEALREKPNLHPSVAVLQAAAWQLLVEALCEKLNLHPSVAVLQAVVWQLMVECAVAEPRMTWPREPLAEPNAVAEIRGKRTQHGKGYEHSCVETHLPKDAQD